jgi:CRP-like cAMP-binding protein
MSEQKNLSTLATFAFARELSPQQRAELAAGARPFLCRPGETLACEGDPSVGLYLITSGWVVLSTEAGRYGQAVVQRVGPGAVVGWSWLIPPHVWQFDVWAEEEVCGYHFEGGWLRQLCAKDASLDRALLRYVAGVLASRLAATRRTFVGCAW